MNNSDRLPILCINGADAVKLIRRLYPAREADAAQTEQAAAVLLAPIQIKTYLPEPSCGAPNFIELVS